MSTTLRSSREVILRTDRFEEAVRFYADVLGLPVSHQGGNIVGFETGAFTLYVEAGRPHEPVFELLVPDVSATKASLLARGCVVVEEDASVPRCYLRDPFGFTFNIGREPGPRPVPDNAVRAS